MIMPRPEQNRIFSKLARLCPTVMAENNPKMVDWHSVYSEITKRLGCTKIQRMVEKQSFQKFS